VGSGSGILKASASIVADAGWAEQEGIRACRAIPLLLCRIADPYNSRHAAEVTRGKGSAIR